MAGAEAPGFYNEAILLLGGAVVAAPLFKRMGLGTVLGYLSAGVVIGPVLGLFADAETMTFPVVHVYDRKGDPWKWFPICKSHSDHHLPGNKGAGVAVDDCAVFFDEQAMHCTTLQFKSYINKEDNAPNLFNVQNLRKRGR